MNSNLIISYLSEQNQLKLIFAKNNILNSALEDIIGYTIDIEEYENILKRINESDILDGDKEKELTEKYYDLTNDEDLRITASDEIESLCEQIRLLNSKIPEHDMILDVYIKNKSQDSEELTIKHIEELILEWIELVAYSEKTIFENKIHEIKRIEEKKYLLIKILENKIFPLRNLANELLLIDAIATNYYSELYEIANESVYSNNFYACFSSKKNELIERYSSDLNDKEQNELVSFYDLITDRLSIN